MNWLFDRKLEKIILKGYSREYRELFKRIINIHQNIWTEENLYTAYYVIRDLLKEAVKEVAIDEGFIIDIK